MIIKYLVNGLVCLALTSGLAHAEKKPAAINDGMVLIPAGTFRMGSDKTEDEKMYREANPLNPFGFNDRLYVDEYPSHEVNLPAYKIDKYEVTNAQYRTYVIATKHKVPFTWLRNGYRFGYEALSKGSTDDIRDIASNIFKLDMDVTTMSRENILAELKKVLSKQNQLPVTAVTWEEAKNFCEWMGKRLPTEAEWEKAARGPENFEYPWGNTWDTKKINTMSEDQDAPYSAVGSYPGDLSPYGAYDMGANVSEWVNDWYEAYPDAPPSDIKYFGKTQRVVRGGVTSSGHYDSVSVVFRSAKRTHLLPNSALIDVGFRCAKDAK